MPNIYSDTQKDSLTFTLQRMSRIWHHKCIITITAAILHRYHKIS